MNTSGYASKQDAELERMAAGGDRDAFAELYNRHFDRVYDFSLRLLRDPDEAADVAQETFLKAMAALSPKEKHAAFTTWILTIARNLSLNRLRARKGREAAPSLEQTESEAVYQQVDTDRLASPEEALEAKELAGLVWQAATALDPKQYSLLDLHLRQGLDSGEIATMLGTSKNNAYVMLNRLRASVEESITAFIMARRGRRECVGLNELLEGRRTTSFTPEMKKAVARHIEGCSTCQEERKKLVSATEILGAFAAVPVPFGLKQQAMAKVLGQWSALAGSEAAKAGGFLSNLFHPLRAATGGAKQAGWFAGWKGTALVASAILVTAGAGGGVLVYSGALGGGQSGEQAAVPKPPTATEQVQTPIPTIEVTSTPEPIPSIEDITASITRGFEDFNPTAEQISEEDNGGIDLILGHLQYCNDSMQPFTPPGLSDLFDPNINKLRYTSQVLIQCEHVGGATKELFLAAGEQGLVTQRDAFLQANRLMGLRHKALIYEIGRDYEPDGYWRAVRSRDYDISLGSSE